MTDIPSANFPSSTAVVARRTGRPRSFGSILGLSIVTFTIYYIVYNYLTAIELKKSVHFSDDETYKPVTFMWIYTAVVGFWLLIMVFSILTAMVSAFSSDPDQVLQIFSGPFVPVLTGLQILFEGLAFYAAFYFLKLYDNAASKVSLARVGVVKPVTAYGIAFCLSIMGTLIGAGMNQDIMGNLESGADIAKLLAVGGFAFLLGMASLALKIYYLWERTELVNRIWLQGRFDESQSPYSQQIGAQQGGYQQASYQTTPAPPTAPTTPPTSPPTPPSKPPPPPESL